MRCDDIKILHLACKKERDDAVALLKQYIFIRESLGSLLTINFSTKNDVLVFEDFERKVNKFIKSLEVRSAKS